MDSTVTNTRNYKSVDFSLIAADTDGIAQSQTPLAGGNLTLNGALGTTLDNRQVLFTFAADESGRTFTITGKSYDSTVTETVAGGVGTAVSVNFYTEITSIAIDAASLGAIQVGTNGVAATRWLTIDYLSKFPAVTLEISLSSGASLNWTAQYTCADYLSLGNAIPTTRIFDHDDSNLVSQTVKRVGNFVSPVTAVRLKTNSYTSGTATLTVIQGTE